VASTLGAPDLYPIAEAMEVFQGDPAAGVMGALDEGLADPMVLDLTEAGFLARELAEVFFGRFGADQLEAVAERGVTGADLLDLGAGVASAIAVGGEVDNAKVDAEEGLDRTLGLLRDFDGDVEEELALAVDQLRFAPFSLEEVGEVGADDGGAEDPLVEGRQGDGGHAIAEGIEALVEADSAEGTEVAEGLLVLRVAVRDLGDDADGQLGLETEAGAQLAVVQFLELELVKALRLKGFDREPGGGLVAATQGSEESNLLLFCRHYLDRCHQFHRPLK
jgi:hypothetical protein